MPLPRALVALSVLIAAASSSLGAQRSPVSIDLSLGGGAGVGGAYSSRRGVVLDALVSVRARSLVVAATAGWQGGYGDDIGGDGIPFRGRFPEARQLAVLAGVERRLGGAASVQLLGGMTRANLLEPGEPDETRRRYWGPAARASIAAPAGWRAAPLLTFHSFVLPDVGGSTLTIWATTLGLRLR